MTITAIAANGRHVATLHTGWVCPTCNAPLAIRWQHTALGLVPVVADEDGHPVDVCPRCGEAVDALHLWTPDTMRVL